VSLLRSRGFRNKRVCLVVRTIQRCMGLLQYHSALDLRCGSLRQSMIASICFLNSCWTNQDSTYKYFEVILVEPQHEAIRRAPRINWIIKPVHKVRIARNIGRRGQKLANVTAPRSPWPHRYWQEMRRQSPRPEEGDIGGNFRTLISFLGNSIVGAGCGCRIAGALFCSSLIRTDPYRYCSCGRSEKLTTFQYIQLTL
jgi:Ribosomal L15